MIEQSEFRRVIGHFSTGVTVVTSCREDGSPCGLTVSAVSSLSLEPTLILACVDRWAESHACMQAAGFFAVNVLGELGEALARRFAISNSGDKFLDVRFRSEATGAPVLDEALAWMDCRTVAIHPGGDHTIFVGEVMAGDAGRGEPLVYYRGGFGRFAP